MDTYLLIDSGGIADPPDPDVFASVVAAALRSARVASEVRIKTSGPAWPDYLPRPACAVFALISQAPAPDYADRIARWLNADHRLFIAYTDSTPLPAIASLRALTADQPMATPPYRVAQQTAMGWASTAQWIAATLAAINAESDSGSPPVKVAPSRWRNLPSNPNEEFPTPPQFTTSQRGAGDYQMIAASHRGKTHAHHGTFREDAVALGVTKHWNILAVADGAGSAELARIGSNTAVREAIAAVKQSMPEPPAAEDVARAIWAGLDAAYGALDTYVQEHNRPLSDLNTTLQLLIHHPLRGGCLLGLVHVGDGIIAAETVDGQYYNLSEPDVDPEDTGRTLFLTSAKVAQWKRRTKVYQFDQPISIVAMMTDGLSGDLEAMGERLSTHLLEPLRARVLCYPLKDRERALLEYISYERRGSFDDRSLAVLSKD